MYLREIFTQKYMFFIHLSVRYCFGLTIRNTRLLSVSFLSKSTLHKHIIYLSRL
jgi:hypothetical protein